MASNLPSANRVTPVDDGDVAFGPTSPFAKYDVVQLVAMCDAVVVGGYIFGEGGDNRHADSHIQKGIPSSIIVFRSFRSLRRDVV
jgi:hypothetical protein